MAEPLWTVGEIAKAIGGETYQDGATAVTGVSIDTRTLQPAECFVAIKGVSLDGHKFVPAAFEAGAACAIVDRDYEDDDPRLIRVGDPFEALQDLGRAARARATKTKIIAVTGSAGKTGTKEALRLALAPSGSVHASAKSYNNHWGVPLTLANMRKDTAFGVFEAGMNHAGELTPLSRMIRPHIAIITTIAPVHLGHFASVEEIADAKAEIFQGLEPGGVAILNRDNEFFGRLATAAKAKDAKIVSFGEAEGSDIRLLDVSLTPEGSAVEADLSGTKLSYRLGAPGRHLVQNSLAVLAAAQAAGADLKEAAAALLQWRAQAGRGEWQVFEGARGKVAVVDEAYNANPASMRAALETLGLVPRDVYCRRIVVLGDMLELGEGAEEFHRGLAQFIDAAGIDSVFACGELMPALIDALPDGKKGGYASAAGELTPLVLDAVRPGDIVMVKGSFGAKLAPLVTELKRHLEDGALN
ncbi:UDP-N-acetylmuramoylalanyl-D-glutamyl-2,6-diaminopimelate--D-alanyl-D-alanine ligase [Methyloligella solikamskensis]|uniref:UDP-N-acetylmuramoyl-tripeptide--D-alanyl-D-alanine ligase n=1 Tax=Methyloligella solikamskensis TaxID=1177756 RepID=A0ABW3JC66_9HYPH